MNRTQKIALCATGAVAAALFARAVLRGSRRFSFAGKSVVVTGGSRGLGLVMARKLVEQGARVTIAARTEADLEAARQELEQMGGEVLAVPCDVRDPQQAANLVRQAVERFGTVDVLFNVAGVIQVGPLDAMTDDDFKMAMDTHCWGPLNMVRAVLPIMRKNGWGRITNVASIGGKRAVPHLIPYCTSKFALVGLSEGLRMELAKENILVTTVCPSLMRTGSPRNAIFKAQHRKEYAWFSVGDSLPLLAMNAQAAANQILDACQRGDAERMISNRLNVPAVFQSLMPAATRELATLADRFLPQMGGIGDDAARGYESESAWSPSLLTASSEKAAQENNQMRPHPIE